MCEADQGNALPRDQCLYAWTLRLISNVQNILLLNIHLYQFHWLWYGECRYLERLQGTEDHQCYSMFLCAFVGEIQSVCGTDNNVRWNRWRSWPVYEVSVWGWVNQFAPIKPEETADYSSGALRVSGRGFQSPQNRFLCHAYLCCQQSSRGAVKSPGWKVFLEARG